MDSEALRSLQAPLKARYREEPAAAVVTLRAQGEVGGGGLSCRVETGGALVEAGLHPVTGGDGTLACSGDMLLEALVACAGVTLAAVATALGIRIERGTVSAQAEFDARGTLGVDREAPVGLRDICLGFDLVSDASPEQQDSLLKLTERYCVVLQTLKSSPAVTTNLRVTPP